MIRLCFPPENLEVEVYPYVYVEKERYWYKDKLIIAPSHSNTEARRSRFP